MGHEPRPRASARSEPTQPDAYTLAFRAATALFGHLGVEWNVARLDGDRRAALAEAIALHKQFRPLLHSGIVVRFDTTPAHCAHGVYAAGRSEGLVSSHSS